KTSCSSLLALSTARCAKYSASRSRLDQRKEDELSSRPLRDLPLLSRKVEGDVESDHEAPTGSSRGLTLWRSGHGGGAKLCKGTKPEIGECEPVRANGHSQPFDAQIVEFVAVNMSLEAADTRSVAQPR